MIIVNYLYANDLDEGYDYGVNSNDHNRDHNDGADNKLTKLALKILKAFFPSFFIL